MIQYLIEAERLNLELLRKAETEKEKTLIKQILKRIKQKLNGD